MLIILTLISLHDINITTHLCFVFVLRTFPPPNLYFYSICIFNSSLIDRI